MAVSEVILQPASAAAAQALTTLVIYPIEFLQKKIAASTSKENSGTVAKQVIEKHGLVGMYRGILFKTLQTVLDKFGYFFFYALLKNMHERMLIGGREIGTIGTLVWGYFSDMLCLPVTYPLETVLTRIQARNPKFHQFFSEFL